MTRTILLVLDIWDNENENDVQKQKYYQVRSRIHKQSQNRNLKLVFYLTGIFSDFTGAFSGWYACIGPTTLF